MPNSNKEFFIEDNAVKLESELDYGVVDHYIRSAEAFSRLTYQSVYIIDYYRRNFLYVSPNSLFLCGRKPEEIIKMGYSFYSDCVPDEDRKLLIINNRAGFAFYNSIPVDERKDWYIQYDFRIIRDDKPVLINHKLTPLTLTSDGRIWLALCVVSVAAHADSGHVEMHKIGSPDFYAYNYVTRRWVKQSVQELTDAERQVITLSSQGYTMNEIAERMCLSADTIKKYRKQIFEKLEVRNISEAIVAATNNKLI